MGFMNLILKFVDIVLHLDKYLGGIISQYGVWTYLIIFAVLFFETGIVFTPFLPGDSLLFTAGTMAASIELFKLKLWILYLVCFFAVVIGDNCNYWIGHFIGDKILRSKRKLINKEYVIKTKKYFSKYGSATLIIGRFMPIIRTFTPFMAGVGKMKYLKFFIYDFIGAFLWVSLFLLGGYFFGGLPFVKAHFSLIVILIIFVSFTPVFYQVGKHFFEKWHKKGKNSNLKKRVKK
jgi:membrane-associated protein